MFSEFSVPAEMHDAVFWDMVEKGFVPDVEDFELDSTE